VVETETRLLEVSHLVEFALEVISCVHTPEELKTDSVFNGLKRILCSVTANKREDLDCLGVGGYLFPIIQDLLVAGARVVRVLETVVNSSKID